MNSYLLFIYILPFLFLQITQGTNYLEPEASEGECENFAVEMIGSCNFQDES